MNLADRASNVIFDSGNVSKSEELHRARCFLRNDAQNILLKIKDINDWISLIFLVLEEEVLPYDGFKLTNEAICGNNMHISSYIIKQLMKTQRGSFESVFDPIIEALFHIGHHDILEDDLQLCFKHNMTLICENLQTISPDQLSLFKVFSELTEIETDHIISTRLRHWLPHNLGDSFERSFLRNLTPSNYLQLLTDIYKALELENNCLANNLRDYAINDQDLPSQLGTERPVLYPGLTPDDFYPLPTCEPHGLCIIVNVKRFHPSRGNCDELALDKRLGSDVDKLRLEGTFKLFGFEICKLDDPTKPELETLFYKIRTSGRLWAMKCLVVCVMTHGDIEDQIYMADREPISVTELRKLCYSRAMIGKPKLYFVQACRGEGRLRPMMLQCDNTTVSSNSETDCLIAAATVKGYSAIRSQSSG